ncbi:MAG TPA: MFS transporter [Acidimicrobiales bacterium]|nr:MFS transporter [Acidimicrobiales bacterium]
MSDLSANGAGGEPAGDAAIIRPDIVEPSEPTGQAGGGGPIDASRVRSFIGLSIGLVGPRANLAVSGVLITLFVQQRASGALAVTFALTANRLLSWVTYPLVGRLSDRTRSRVGRRTPYMAGSLILMGAATWMFTVVRGYWMLVLFILIARQAAAIFTLTNAAVIPEVFGRSRWLKALLLTTVLGTVASLGIKATVIATWKQSDPATWNLPFQVAAVIMAGVGLIVLLLVREAPAASFGAETDRGARARRVRDELRSVLAGPNAKVLVTGSLLFWSGIGSTAFVAVLFFQRVLHAGASAQTVAGLATGVPIFFIGIGLGIPFSRILSPRQLAIGAPLVGAVLAGVQYFDTHLWQAVVLSYIGAPFIGAYIIVLAPMLLQLLPRSGGLGERLGVLLSPFNLCSVALAYVAATVVDATGNYRLIWLFPAATGVAHATVNCWLKIPSRKASSPDMVKRVWEWAMVQAESMAETGIVTGLLAAPLLGVVTKEDADSAVIVDMARKILGNPYGDDEEVEESPSELPPGPGLTDSDKPDEPDKPDQSRDSRESPESPESPESRESRESPEPSDRGVTGVIQVGGGPVGTDLWIDQKSGPRTGSESDSSDPSELLGSGGASPAAGRPDSATGQTGTPAGGVIPNGSEGTPVGSNISHASGAASSDQSAKDPSDGSMGPSAASSDAEEIPPAPGSERDSDDPAGDLSTAAD